MFAVRTPTAVVTDLGTEFGVEVDKSGATQSHVFRGKVEVRLGDGKGEARVVQLGAGESARVGPDRDQVVRIIRGTSGDAQPLGFARQMPKRVRIELFNTGVGLKEGAPDPHWQLVARSDDPDFQPRPAVVTRVAPGRLANDPARWQWISAVGDLSCLPEDVTYTFRTTFDLSGTLPDTAVLRGTFLVDDHVDAIRFNGRRLDVPEHAYGESSTLYHYFKTTSGFVEGTNVLEIDVFNGGHPWGKPTGGTPMMCRVKMEGSVVCDPATTSDDTPPASRGKEGASMNGP